MNSSVLPRPTVEHKQLSTANGVVHYVQAGVGAPLLLIHGGHGAWVHWIANIDALAQHHKVVALDLPGFGASYDPGRLLELSAYRAVVSAVIESLDLRNVAIVGFSFGSLVASAVASHHPDIVTSLTLINPPGIGNRSAEALALPGHLSALAKAGGLQAGVAGTLKELMLYDSSLVEPELIDLIADCVVHTKYVTRFVSRQSDMLAMLHNIAQPRLILLGAEDPYQQHHIVDRGAQIKAVLGSDAVTIVDDAAHWLQFERAEFFHRTLLAFIGQTMDQRTQEAHPRPMPASE